MIRKPIIYILACLGISLSSCVRESESGRDCSSYVRFVYDYNMAFEDLFHNQVTKMDLYIFDGSGKYVTTLSHECAAGTTFSRDYMMKLPDDLIYPVELVAWSGLHSETLKVTALTAGVSTKHDLEVALYDNNEVCNSELRGLWHGSVVKADADPTDIDITVIPLTKNTNYIRIVLQMVENNIGLDVDDFYFSLQCTNHCYDYSNQTAAARGTWSYEPCYTENDKNTGAIAEIHTLRFYDDEPDRSNRLYIEFTPNGSTVLDINLNNYINALKLAKYGTMPLQEYMDREDEYKIIIFLTGDPEEGYMAADISINGWFMRDQEENQ